MKEENTPAMLDLLSPPHVLPLLMELLAGERSPLPIQECICANSLFNLTRR
jgi:hypothetical protein